MDLRPLALRPLQPKRLLAMLVLSLVLLCLFASLAFAQGPAPMPTPPPGPLTTMAMVILCINIVVGFIGQGIGQGNILGIVTVPKAYVPYLTVLAAFGTSVGGSLAMGWPVLAAILYALLGLATGAGIAHHVGTPARTQAMTDANEGKPPASAAPPAGSAAGKVGGALSALLVVLGLGAIIGTQAACPQAQAAIGPGITFAECVVGKYLTEPAGTPMPTVIADEIVACGGDAAAVVRVLNVHEAPALHASVAHEGAK